MSDINQSYDEDAAYIQAVGLIVVSGRVSTSYIQRYLGIGFNKAARLVERAEADGIIARANHVGKREVLFKARSAQF